METKKVPLTKEAHERLTEELADLEGPARMKVIEEIATARAHGDLSENAEYHAAKDQQGMQEARIRQIRDMLEHAEIIETTDDDIVGPGKLVKISIAGDDPEVYLFGTREERGGDHDVLTVDSPIGRAIQGTAAGDTVVARPGQRDLEVQIVEVTTP
ncbi:MAG TPA: transcription elongation factor GreA [Actinomycetota bacterium]|nr:transcription elongation factor GreA [Actinomycetota bacterium]